MQHADASGVRGNLADSGFAESPLGEIAARGSFVTFVDGPDRNLSRFSWMSWRSFWKSEALLRRLIPAVIIVLLLMAAGARTVSLIASGSQIDQQTRAELALRADLIAQNLVGQPNLLQHIESPTLASAMLADALPQTAGVTIPAIFLLNRNRLVVAHDPDTIDFEGVHITRLTGDQAVPGMLDNGKQPAQILLDGRDPALAILVPVRTAEGTRAGSLFVAYKTGAIYAQWYSAVKLNLILFLATGSVILVILYAYFSLGVRAQKADRVFIETNARFDTALARGHCGLWDWDLSRGRIVWSRSMFEMLGLEPTTRVMGYGELAGMLHAEDTDLMMLANSAFNADQPQIDHRFRIRHASGVWVWLRIRAELVRYKGAEPHLIGIAVDITEQEALKQQTRDADIRLRDAIENISESFVLWDSKKRLVMCNSKYQQLYSLPASAITSGTSFEDVMQQSRQPTFRERVSPELGSESGSKSYEAQINDGRWLQINEKRTQDGGFVSVGTDITQIKRNESKLVDSERKLMATITDLRESQRQLEYQAQQLVELADDLSDQKNKAEAGNKSKSQFLANISHELRTPLNAIIGFSDIMRSQMFGPLGTEKYYEYADDIHDSGAFLLGVINDVLDMSKIEAGRFELAPEETDLHVLLDETIRIIHIQAEEAELSVKQNIPENLMIEADRRAIKQIMLNLLSNAVKFTPAGGKIDITARCRTENVEIVITDTGVGIATQDMKRIGKPFEQVQDQFTKDHKGSGLGLAIARSLALLHGGSLEIDSTEGAGTTVSIILPTTCAQPGCADAEDLAA